jgi:hypothetical protein
MINCPILAKLRAPGVDQLIPLFLKRLERILSILPSIAPMVSTGSPFSFSGSILPGEGRYRQSFLLAFWHQLPHGGISSPFPYAK